MDLYVTVKRRTAVEAAALATADACIGHVRRPSLEPGSAYGHPYAPSPPRAGSAAIQRRAPTPAAGSGPSFRFARGSGRARAASFLGQATSIRPTRSCQGRCSPASLWLLAATRCLPWHRRPCFEGQRLKHPDRGLSHRKRTYTASPNTGTSYASACFFSYKPQ